MNVVTSEADINAYGRFDDLKKTADRDKAEAHFETIEGESMTGFQLSMRIDKLLKDFILRGSFDISEGGTS